MDNIHKGIYACSHLFPRDMTILPVEEKHGGALTQGGECHEALFT